MGPREAVVAEPRRGEEVQMSLQRDELAARAMAARAALLSLCDALSALVPVAPASGAPLAAPSPSPEPAATPAAWVPSVGDVVAPNGEWAKRGGCDEAVVRYVREGDIDKDRCGVGIYILKGSHGCQTPEVSHDLTYLRRATSSERAAAGLPVDESAGGWMPMLRVEKTECPSCGCRFDAIKAPAFDEAQEREAFCGWLNGWGEASKWGVAGFDNVMDQFMWRAWLARARVAAKEPRSGDCRPASGVADDQGGAK